ncbi:MAG TPA: endonuclease/exonuclease/phosphatase family protein [Longimicrobium sp.]|nr:endonuclease/exonuclease/phosphatase family protein [Longimicrobium sp.]
MILRIARPAGLFVLVASLAAGPAAAQATREVVLDGSPREWEGVPWAAGGEGASGNGATARHSAPISPHPSPRGVRVRHDADAVYLLVTLDREVALQSLEGSLVVLMDADGDAASGWAEHGVAGVDAALEFSPVWPNGMRAGTALRMHGPGADPARLVSAYQAGVIAAPSHASRTFEVRIRRGGAVRFGARMTARVLSMAADGTVADSLPAFTVSLARPAARPVPRGQGAVDPLARAAGAQFRVVSWNVGRETIFRNPEPYGAILRALAADLLILEEVAGGHSAEEVEALLNRMVPGDRPWHAVYGVSGGSQREVIATRGRRPVMSAPFDRELPYPDSTRALVPADAPEQAVDWLRSRLDVRIPATGAVVEMAGRRLMVVTMDLESAGAPGSTRDRLRRIEALEIRRAAQAAVLAGAVDGLLVAGDLNLVGSTEPLQVLSRGMDVAGRPLEIALPLGLDGVSVATWENPAEPFIPSRLDYVLYTRSMLEWAGGFVFRSGDLSARWLARHGLTAETSSVTDHLPVVTDLRWAPAGR